MKDELYAPLNTEQVACPLCESLEHAATFAVDNNARLCITRGAERITLSPTEMLVLMDFVSVISYRGLARLCIANGGQA